MSGSARACLEASSGVLGFQLAVLCAGPRTAKGIAEAATSALHDKLISRPTTLEAFSAFLKTSKLPKVMLQFSWKSCLLRHQLHTLHRD